jgi:hypothetical protein
VLEQWRICDQTRIRLGGFPAGGEDFQAHIAGIYLSNGQGATITLIGPTVAIKNTGLTITGP